MFIRGNIFTCVGQTNFAWLVIQRLGGGERRKEQRVKFSLAIELKCIRMPQNLVATLVVVDKGIVPQKVLSVLSFCPKYTGCFFHWYPPKKLKYGKPRSGESTLT